MYNVTLSVVVMPYGPTIFSPAIIGRGMIGCVSMSLCSDLMVYKSLSMKMLCSPDWLFNVIFWLNCVTFPPKLGL